MLQTLKPALFAAALAVGIAGCSHHHEEHHSTIVKAAEMGDVKEAVAVMHGTKGNEKVMGTVKFTDTGKGVQVMAHVEGLNPGQEHGFHVHEFGDATGADGMSAGGHYDPEGHKTHGKPGADKMHVGDMGNLKADDKGVAHLEVMLPNASITGKNALIGRGVIVHAKPDDGSQPTGNAGARIGIGVIGVAQVKK
jgi:Cu-Zn family superoxide dismutase